MMVSSLCWCAVGNRIVAPARLLARGEKAVDARLHIVGPEPRQAVRESEHDRDEERAETKQPELRKGFRQAGLGEVYQNGPTYPAEARHPSADRGVNPQLDRRHDADKGRRHETDIERDHGP